MAFLAMSAFTSFGEESSSGAEQRHVDCFSGKPRSLKKIVCKLIPISRTSKGNENWFEKSGVREIEGGIFKAWRYIKGYSISRVEV